MQPFLRRTCLVALFIIAAPVSRGQIPEALVNFAAAKIVIGQANFTSGDCNHGEDLAGARKLCVPEGAPSRRKGRLYLPDSSNNRVQGFNHVPQQNDAAAKFVLGQPDLSSSSFGLPATDSTFDFPARLTTSAHKLFVADFSNSRVLIWNKLPKVTGSRADVVVGQPDFTSTTASTTQSGLDLPEGITVGGRQAFRIGSQQQSRIDLEQHPDYQRRSGGCGCRAAGLYQFHARHDTVQF